MITDAVQRAIDATTAPPDVTEPTPIRPMRLRVPLPRHFGRWLVVGSAMWDEDQGRPTVRVECDCGRVTRSVDLRDLRSGKSTQCRECRGERGRV